MVFVRKCKDKKNRQDASLSDKDLCGVIVEVINFMKDNNAPALLQQNYLKQLMTLYEVDTHGALMRKLKEKAKGSQHEDEHENENSNENGNERGSIDFDELMM